MKSPVGKGQSLVDNVEYRPWQKCGLTPISFKSLTQNIFMIRKALPIVVVSIAIQGCSSIGEPLGLRPGTLGMFDPTRAEEISKGSPDVGIETPGGQAVPEVIVVGRVRMFEAMQPEESEAIYRRQYLTFVETWENPREPTLSMDEFVSTISGFCRVSLWSTPVVEISMDALVPVDIVDRIQYPGILDMLLWTGVGDLVAARTNNDGVLIVERILCSEGSGYGRCSKSYAKGFFDATTGRELSYRGKVKKDGLVVDTTHYKVVEREIGEIGVEPGQ